MAGVFHYPWRIGLARRHWRLPAPLGDDVSPELGAFVSDGDDGYVEVPGPSMREGVGQVRVQVAGGRQLLYAAGHVHQFQQEPVSAPVRRLHFALTDAFIWLSAFLYRHREDTGAPLADRKLSEACAAFGEYLGSQKDFAPESLIVEIARGVPSAVESIVAGPRKVLTRRHTEVPLDKIQEMDVFSLADLARRPGRTVAMKAGPKQRLTALTRSETADTVENRVVLDFILRSGRTARQYVDEMCSRCPRGGDCALHDPMTENACPSARLKLVAGYARHCAAWVRSGALAEVARLAEPRTRPNYVLQQNIRYVKVWRHYLRLLRLEDVEEGMWRGLRAAWSDFAKMLFMMVWEARLRPGALLQTSNRPFMIRAENRGGRWFVPTPFEDALVFQVGRAYRTLYLLAPGEAAELTGRPELAAIKADFVVVVARGGGDFAIRPVWTFCPDAKCQERAAQELAEAAAEELAATEWKGVCLFPCEDNVSAVRGGAACLGLDVFCSARDAAFAAVEDVLREVLA